MEKKIKISVEITEEKFKRLKTRAENNFRTLQEQANYEMDFVLRPRTFEM